MNASKRLALVTGGMGGLGEAICKRLSVDGLQVVATYSPSNDHHDRWLSSMHEQGFEIDAVCIDVSRFEACRQGVESVRARYGPVSVLVNNAGITSDASFRKMTEVDWRRVMETNLDSVFNMTKQVIEDMVAQGFGRIVNISSVNGQRGAYGQANYAASKAGMHGFTKALALEFARKGITVNTVSPGYLDTAMVAKVPKDILQSRILPEIALGRLGRPDEVAQLVSYVVSDGAAFTTGADLSINGGQHMS